MPKIFRTKAHCDAVRRLRFQDRMPIKDIAERFGVWPAVIRDAIRKGPIKIKEVKR